MKTGTQLFQPPEVKVKKVNSEHQEIILKLLAFMNEPESRYRYWCGRTRGISPQSLYRLMKQAEGGKPKQRLFNWLLREFKKKKLIINKK